MELRRILLAALVCSALALPACGDDSGGGSTLAPTATTVPAAEALALAEARVLQLEDLPAGFSLVAGEESTDDTEDATAETDADELPARCDYILEWDRVGEGRDVDVEYAYADGIAMVTHEVTVLDGPTAKRIMEALAAGPTAECLQVGMESVGGLAVGAAIDETLSVAAISVTSDQLGQKGDTLRYTVTVNLHDSATGETHPLKSNMVVQRVDGMLSMLETMDTAELPVTMPELEALVAKKMQAA